MELGRLPSSLSKSIEKEIAEDGGSVAKVERKTRLHGAMRKERWSWEPRKKSWSFMRGISGNVSDSW